MSARRFVPYTGEDGLRDYRTEPMRRPPAALPWMVAVLIFVLGLLVGAVAVQGAEPPVVTLTARPTILLTRGDIRLEARVPPDAANRGLALVWTSDIGTEGRSLRPLDGADDAFLHTWELRDQPPANYAFVADVVDARGHVRGSAHAEVHMPRSDGGA